MKELKTKFYENKTGLCLTPCPFGVESRVNSGACSMCDSFIRVDYDKRPSWDVPIQGDVYCYGNDPDMKENKRCLVPNCTNRPSQGTFVGNLCGPCHDYIVAAVDNISTACNLRNKITEEYDEKVQSFWDKMKGLAEE